MLRDRARRRADHLISRICPGRHFAVNTLRIYIASTLHVFNITPGTDVQLSTEYVGGIVTYVSYLLIHQCLTEKS